LYIMESFMILRWLRTSLWFNKLMRYGVLPKSSNTLGVPYWYVSNVSIIFDALCLFMHHLPCVLLHFVAFLCIF
jgi:hypothetical protein